MAMIVAPCATSAQGFFNLYGSAPRKQPALAAAPGPGGMAGTPVRLASIDPMIPSLSDLGARVDDIGMNTLVPDLGDTSIPTDPGARTTPGRTIVAKGPDHSVCISVIRAAEKKRGVPENLLMAIGIQEAGRQKDGQLTIWPWSVNSHGQTHMFDTKAEAISFVRAEQARGKTLIDVGCMQVNLRWHPDAFASLEEAFDPAVNADYAGGFLARLQDEAGDWMTAAGNYHSFTPQHHARYLAGIKKNLDVALAYTEDFDKMTGERTISTTPDVQLAVANPQPFGQSAGRSFAGARGYARRAETLVQPVAAPSPEVIGDMTEYAAEGPPTGAWWSADGSGSETARSIYSRRDLKPVLPVIAQGSPEEGA